MTSAAQLGAAPDRRHVVVLDNCEHCSRGLAAVVADVLAASPRLRVLATSRERLRLAAEREYAVPPLPMPSADEVDDPARLRDNPAIALLLDRAPGGVRLTPGTARALAEICIGLDGLPLAIELAAARLRVFTPSELAFRLDRRMSVLTTNVGTRRSATATCARRSPGATASSPSASKRSSGGCRCSSGRSRSPTRTAVARDPETIGRGRVAAGQEPGPTGRRATATGPGSRC